MKNAARNTRSRPGRWLLGAAAAVSLISANLIVPPAAHADTTPCYRSDYGCVAFSGYSGAPEWGADPDSHNCVSYAAFRLRTAGAVQPWFSIGNARDWDDKARASSPAYLVNTIPVVGSVYQTDDGGGGFGHVAIVDEVTSTTIKISEDAYLGPGSGYTATRVLDRNGAAFKKAVFIHVKDNAHRRGDIDGDGRVNAIDLSILIKYDNTRRGNGNDLAGDFSHDGYISSGDLAILLAGWTW